MLYPGDGVLMFGNRLCVPNVVNLRRDILEESHCSTFAMHPGVTKMYRDLKHTIGGKV